MQEYLQVLKTFFDGPDSACSAVIRIRHIKRVKYIFVFIKRIRLKIFSAEYIILIRHNKVGCNQFLKTFRVSAVFNLKKKILDVFLQNFIKNLNILFSAQDFA